jgi:hypothetical protein
MVDVVGLPGLNVGPEFLLTDTLESHRPHDSVACRQLVDGELDASMRIGTSGSHTRRVAAPARFGANSDYSSGGVCRGPAGFALVPGLGLSVTQEDRAHQSVKVCVM